MFNHLSRILAALLIVAAVPFPVLATDAAAAAGPRFHKFSAPSGAKAGESLQPKPTRAPLEVEPVELRAEVNEDGELEWVCDGHARPVVGAEVQP